jgi:3-hydroxyacyl-CoA dehydrogenase/enoyl-CoA hydratase/3-hydroxybutyryl-CoA epimerase
MNDEIRFLQGDQAASESGAYHHWRLERDFEGIAWLHLDREGEDNNTLSRAVMQELERIVRELTAAPPSGLVLLSAKKSGFAVGADVREFEGFTDSADVQNLIRSVHELFERIEGLPFPTVAAIHGFCLGGGLELALACDYRIARNIESTRLGFPEVKLGIFPGFGGAMRTTALIGGRHALEIMLTGRNLRPGAARAMGLLDELVSPHESLRWAARRAVLAKRVSRGAGRLQRASNWGPVRPLLAKFMRSQVAKKARSAHYPAPYALIDLWERCGNNRRCMLDGEASAVASLLLGQTSSNLRRVFHLMERVKALGKSSDMDVRRVHVVGAGVMGGDIAAWCVASGLEVTLQDRGQEYIAPALRRAEKLFRRRLKRAEAVMAARDRLIADVEGNGVKCADVVIEAIFEDRDAKQALYRELEPKLKTGAVLATNTSAIPLEELAVGLQQPQRLVGLHFFNPVAQMPLVEVVHGETTDPEQTRRACAFATRIGKLPLPVKSSPGFLVNRVLAPYFMEALKANGEGIPKEAIDEAALVFGMPMGPVELADTVGLDVCLMVSGTLAEDSAKAEKVVLQGLVDSGKLGKKSGSGFYQWKKGRPLRNRELASGHDLDSLGQRLIAPLLEECRAALDDGVVEGEDLADAGVIFGTGFAPFRGGPLHYMAGLVANPTGSM